MTDKKGTILPFGVHADAPIEESMEAGLNRVFWDGVETDIQHMVALFLMEANGYEVAARDYAEQLITFRSIQGESPSTAQADVQKAFAYASAGNTEAVKQAFARQTALVKEKELQPDDPHYVTAVREMVAQDNSEPLAFFLEKWYGTTEKMNNMAALAAQTNEKLFASTIVDALKTLDLADDAGNWNGLALRHRAEEIAGEKLPMVYRLADFDAAPAKVLKFPNPRKK